MRKLDRIITALDLCKYDPDPGQEDKYHHSCLKCPYHDPEIPRCVEMNVDAIELLKKQDEKIKKLNRKIDRIWTGR